MLYPTRRGQKVCSPCKGQKPGPHQWCLLFRVPFIHVTRCPVRMTFLCIVKPIRGYKWVSRHYCNFSVKRDLPRASGRAAAHSLLTWRVPRQYMQETASITRLILKYMHICTQRDVSLGFWKLHQIAKCIIKYWRHGEEWINRRQASRAELVSVDNPGRKPQCCSPSR